MDHSLLSWSASEGSVARALPAVDMEGLSGHEARRLEIEDGVHDVDDLAHSADRVQGAELRIGLDRVHRRLDDAGCDRVHANAALGVLDGERFGRRGEAAL